jgi:glycosyltransferase involved in cell wall biosynthesis
MTASSGFAPCLLIPHFNHYAQFERIVTRLRDLGLPGVVVDDGSHREHISALRKLATRESWLELICHASNRGKGAALKTGFVYARVRGYSHVIQIDADGQHTIADVSHFIRAAEYQPLAIIAGLPRFDENIPKIRLFGRSITNYLVIPESLSFQIKDAMCGFRVYPLAAMEYILDSYYIGSRMDFDAEILVKAVWATCPVRFLETRVQYPADGASHFNYLRDNVIMARMHVRLLLGMLLRLPGILLHRLKNRMQ